jgi:RecA/RadA recombinase
VGGASSPANYPSNFALPHYATIRLLLAKERWLYKGADVRGYEARVEVIKNELGPAGRKATIAVTFNGLMKGDGT